MRLGVFTVLYADRSLEQALDAFAALGLEAVEIGTGNYPGNAHCDPHALLAEPQRARAFRRAIESRGLVVSALSQHGNPLHPQEEVARAAHETWRATVRLAELLEVDVVIGFSGCPGDHAGARYPNWVTCSWPDDYPEVLEWQWRERVVPYWSAEAAFARAHGVRVAIEMHPGFVVYNTETLLRLREVAGPQVGANFDPSHLFWQGADPVEAINALGAAGALFHVHAKDTYLDRGNVRVNGVLETKPAGACASARGSSEPSATARASRSGATSSARSPRKATTAPSASSTKTRCSRWTTGWRRRSSCCGGSSRASRCNRAAPRTCARRATKRERTPPSPRDHAKSGLRDVSEEPLRQRM